MSLTAQDLIPLVASGLALVLSFMLHVFLTNRLRKTWTSPKQQYLITSWGNALYAIVPITCSIIFATFMWTANFGVLKVSGFIALIVYVVAFVLVLITSQRLKSEFVQD